MPALIHTSIWKISALLSNLADPCIQSKSVPDWKYINWSQITPCPGTISKDAKREKGGQKPFPWSLSTRSLIKVLTPSVLIPILSAIARPNFELTLVVFWEFLRRFAAIRSSTNGRKNNEVCSATMLLLMYFVQNYFHILYLMHYSTNPLFYLQILSSNILHLWPCSSWKFGRMSRCWYIPDIFTVYLEMITFCWYLLHEISQFLIHHHFLKQVSFSSNNTCNNT